MHRRLPPLAAALLSLALSPSAVAQEYCVTCSGPEATYRCVIGGEESAQSRSSRAQFLCITELAKAGGHASCSAARGQHTPCPGETRTVMFSLAEPGAGPVEATAPPAGAPAGHSFAPDKQLPPVALPAPEQRPPSVSPAPMPPPHDTGSTPAPAKQNAVEEMASKTGKAVTDTGKAVGHAVKKSWDCVTSLFGNC